MLFFLAFTTSRISSFIQTFLDVPISESPGPGLLDYCLRISSLLFEFILNIIASIPLPALTLFHSFLASVLYVTQNTSCLRYFSFLSGHLYNPISIVS